MRTSTKGFLEACLIFGSLMPASDALNLSQFQTITGSSETCQNAYETPLTACSATDFSNGKPCSNACIEFLDGLTHIINTACKGTKALDNTLIGQFFLSKGTEILCPNAVETRGSSIATGAAGKPGKTSSAMAQPKNTLEPSSDILTTTSDISTEVKTESDSSSSTQSGLSSSSSIVSSTTGPTDDPSVLTTASATSESTTAPTVTSTRSTIPLSLLFSSPTTVSVAAQSTTSKSKLKATDGRGGGTPFDITSSSCRIFPAIAWTVSFSAGFILLLWIV